MARARNIKPAIMANEELAELPPMHRLLFIYLWMLSDRAGRLEDRPKRISAQAFPYDQIDADKMLDDLADAGFVQRYSSNGINVIYITNFTKHQSPHGTEKDSTLPSIDGAYTIMKRKANGYAVGEDQKPNRDLTVKTPLDNEVKPVNERPDSLIPSSLIPDTPTDAGKPAPSPPRLITFKTFVDQCKSENRKPIPDDHYIREFCQTAGISNDMLALNWVRFREEHLTGTRSGKKYKDWPGVFANSVKDRWYRLWLVNNEGDATWTNEGLQAKRVAEAGAA